jgi:hypothetical protein
MRKTLFILFALFSLFFFANCQDNHSGISAGGKSRFPPELAGTWRTDDGKWQMSFEPDGSLHSIKYYFNPEPMLISEGGGTDYFKDKPDSVRSIYVFGENSVRYNEKTLVLTVEVAIEHFEIKRPMGRLVGNMMDKFTGRVSGDKKTWTAVWNNQTTFEDIEIDSPASKELVFRHIEKVDPGRAP